jgi:hypothetical protein
MSKPATELILHIQFTKEFGNNKDCISVDCHFANNYHPSYNCTFSKKTSLKNIAEFVVDLFNSKTLGAGLLILKINDQDINVRRPTNETDNTSEHYFNLIASALIV